MTTSITDVQAAGLIRLASEIGSENVAALSLGSAMSDCNRIGGQVLCWNQSQVKTIVSSVFLDRQLAESSTKLHGSKARMRRSIDPASRVQSMRPSARSSFVA